MTLEIRERQLRDESLVMRYPTREYQIDQPSEMPLVSLPVRCAPTLFNHETENDLKQSLDGSIHISCWHQSAVIIVPISGLTGRAPALNSPIPSSIDLPTMAAPDQPLFAVLFVLLAYLLGSISFAVVVSKLFDLDDPRSYGSGNPGATNVLRSGHKVAAVLTLAGDAFKGWAGGLAGLANGVRPHCCRLCCRGGFCGHVFPVFLSFKGGKGVATAFGVILALAPALGLATLLTWLIVAFFFRLSSLAAIAAALFAPFYYFILSGLLWPLNNAFLWALAVIALLLLQRHRANIGRIFKGTEPRIGAK